MLTDLTGYCPFNFLINFLINLWGRVSNHVEIMYTNQVDLRKMYRFMFRYQSSRSCKIVGESHINEIKRIQTDKPLREFTHKNHRKRHFRPDRFS